MADEEKERWRVLCEQASQEHDPQRLVQLVEEINRLLSERLSPFKEDAA